MRGFAIEPAVLSAADLAGLEGSLGRIATRSRAGARHLMSHPAVSSLAQDTRLVRLAALALGMSAIPYRATLFDKSPSSNWLVPWHQDTALPLKSQRHVAGWGPWSKKAGVLYAHAPASALERVVALRIHLDDSTPDNGPLRVVPGTHERGVLTDGQIQELAARLPAEACCIGRGGIVVMRPLLIHASSKATTAEPRRVLHIEYAASLEIGPGLQLAVA